MKVLRLAFAFLILCFALSAQAKPEFLKLFKDVYGKPEAKCLVCHSKVPERNVYGKAIEAALDKAKATDLTAEILKSVEKADSDGDGFSNIDEINAGTAPGDPASKPAAASGGSSKSAGGELIPKHTFHPALVHFPIALLAVAAFLELVGRRKSDQIYHKASIINLALGLFGASAAIVTGIIAWLRLGYSLEGNLLIHLILASLSVLIGIGAYTQREKPHYLWLILVSGILVMVAGHFGGTLVYS